MKQLVTQAIILGRTNYGEADRILTILTPAYGKISVVAKGARRIKSKLAGGIELFSVSEITFIKGKGDIGTLVSARLLSHYSCIVADFERMNIGYSYLRRIRGIVEEQAGSEYFVVLQQVLVALDDSTLAVDIIQLWFLGQILKIGGYMPNVRTDVTGQALDPDMLYNFQPEVMAFMADAAHGMYDARHIKLLRLVLEEDVAIGLLQKIEGCIALTPLCLRLVEAASRQHA